MSRSISCIAASAIPISTLPATNGAYCENGFTATYNSEDKIGGTPHKFTFGGYANQLVVDEQH